MRRGLEITFYPNASASEPPPVGSVWRVVEYPLPDPARPAFRLEPAPELEDLRRRLDETLAAAKRHKADADAARTREFYWRAELARAEAELVELTKPEQL